MKLALNQARRIAIALAIVGVGLVAPSPAGVDVVRDERNAAVKVAAGAVAAIPAPASPRRAVSNAAYDHIIADYAERFDVDAALVKAIIHAESRFRPKARSHRGARGLMQLMPRTAGMYGVASRDLDQPRANIQAGVRHLRSLLKSFAGDVPLAVAAYNAGAGAVRRHGGLPPFRETQNYVRKVLHLHARYAAEVTVALHDRGDEQKKMSPS